MHSNGKVPMGIYPGTLQYMYMYVYMHSTDILRVEHAHIHVHVSNYQALLYMSALSYLYPL